MIIYSIIQKSQLEGNHRLDAEYYQPEYLDLEEKLNSLETKTIEEISKSVISFGAYSLTSYIEWQESGIPYINVGDIHDGYVDLDNVKYISEKVDEILKKSRVTEGQVLLTMAGTIGNAAVAHNFPKRANANQAIAKITLLNNFSPYYLAAFLNSKYGFLQTQREIVSSVQSNIFLGSIKKFKVPIFNLAEMNKVESLYKGFFKKLEESKSLYSQAENLLLEELGLKNFRPEDNLSYIVNLSDVESVDRIDAEYFQPIYKNLESRIKNLEYRKLGNIVSIQKGIEPGSEIYQDKGVPFVRVSNISKFGIKDNNQQYLSQENYNRFKDNFEPKAGEILLTKDATPGIAYFIDSQIEEIISSGILRLKTKIEIESEYLTLVINSIIGQMQAERDTGGSVIIHWRPEQIKNVLIPILPKPAQQKIAALVQKSHAARQKAKQLLEQAKQKVEGFIEK